MKKRRLRWLFLATVVSSAPIVGCGGQEEGTMVEVDEAKEKALTDSMKGYFEKNEPKKPQ